MARVFAVLLLMVPGCGDGETTTSRSEPRDGHADAGQPDWVPHGETAHSGTLRAHVAHVNVGGDELRVFVQLENAGGAYYERPQLTAFVTGARLTDRDGRLFRNITAQCCPTPISLGRNEKTRVLIGFRTDGVAFLKPEETDRMLYLTLPGATLGGEGPIRLRVSLAKAERI